MQIVRAVSRPSQPGPAEWFTGSVFLDPIGAAPPDVSTRAARVTFAPGARTAWHTHPHGQALHVELGLCLVGRDDGTVERLHPGDGAWFVPGENHWHGAGPDTVMVHLAVQQADETGSVAAWGVHVTEAEYTRAGHHG